MTEVSKVIVEQPASVDVARPEVTQAASSGEESMAEYGARREAEMRGETVEKPAAAIIEDEPAAVEDVSAAATEEIDDESKTTPAPAPEEEVKLEEAHPAKKGVEKRFGELTAQREAAKAEAEAAKAEAAAAKAELEKMRAEAARVAEALIPVVPAVEDDIIPDRELFDDPDSYNLAVAAHAARTEIRKANESAIAAKNAREDAVRAQQEIARQAKVTEQIVELHKTFNDRVTTAKTDYADFDEKVTNNESLIVRNDVFFAIERAEMAPHILYHLAHNPSEVANLNKMEPQDAAIRLGEIQAELRIARKPKVSKAAAPIKPVSQRASPERKTPDEMSMEEYAAMRAQEDAKASASRKPRLNH